MEKIYRVQMNSSGMPNFATAVEIDTDISEYSDRPWKNAYERGKADRPQGEWFKDDEGTFICSACGSGYKDQPTLMGKPMFKWCPLCGARMKGDNNE